MLVYGRASGQPEPAKWHQGGIARFLHYKKMVFLLPCNKSLIEQACSIKMTTTLTHQQIATTQSWKLSEAHANVPDFILFYRVENIFKQQRMKGAKEEDF